VLEPEEGLEEGQGPPEGITTVAEIVGSSLRLTDQVPVEVPTATVAMTWSVLGSRVLKLQGVLRELPPCLKVR
jgi:hypothetical protein